MHNLRQYFVLAFLMLTTLMIGHAQALDYQWAHALGSTFGSGSGVECVKTDAAGNTYVIGSLNNGTLDFDPGPGVIQLASEGFQNGFIAKYSAAGGLIWVKSLRCGGGSFANTISIDNAGNIIVGGLFFDNCDFDLGSGTSLLSSNYADLFIAKYDSSGNLGWVKNLQGSSSMDINDLTLDAIGNIYITGTYQGTIDFDPSPGTAVRTALLQDIFMAKYDPNGNYVWANSMGSGNGLTNVGNHIIADNSGNVYITGHFGGTVDFDAGPGTTNLVSAGGTDIYLAKYNSAGAIQWAFRAGAANSDAGHGLGFDSGFNPILTGTFRGTVDFDPSGTTYNLTAVATSMVIAKYSAAGSFVWAKQISSTTTTVVYPYDLATDQSGNIYIGGSFKGSVDFAPGASVNTLTAPGTLEAAFLAKYDASGTNLWADMFAGTASVRCSTVAVGPTGLPSIGGWYAGTADFDPGLGSDSLMTPIPNAIFVGQYNSSTGAHLWARSAQVYAGGGNDEAYSTTVDTLGNVYVTGFFSGTVDFDPGIGVTNLTSAGGQDIFVTKFAPNGALTWAKAIGSSTVDIGRAIKVDRNGNVFVTGNYDGTVDFDPGPGVYNMTSSGYDDVFVLKLNANGDFVFSFSLGNSANFDRGYSLEVNSNDDIWVTGFFGGTTDFDPSGGIANLTATGQGIFLAKYTNSGSLITAKLIDGPGSGDLGKALKTDGAGNLWLIGNFNGNNFDLDPSAGVFNLSNLGSNDGFVAKYDQSGNFLIGWAIQGTAYDNVSSLAIASTGDLFVGGNFQGTVDFDPGLGTASRTSVGDFDGFVAKYSAQGVFTWVRQFEGTGAQNVNALGADALGGCIVGGNSVGPMDLDPGLGSQMMGLPITAYYDAFLANLDSAGNLVVAYPLGSLGQDDIASISVSAANELVVAGYLQGEVDFDFSPATTVQVNNGKRDVFIAKYSLPCTVATLNLVSQSNVTCNGGNNGSATVAASGGTGFSYLWSPIGGNAATATSLIAGTYQCITTSQCGSRDTVSVTITEPTSATHSISASACTNYMLNGQTYTSSGTYTQVLSTTLGCDSTITLNLTIGQPSSATITQAACDSFTLNSQTFTSTGTYTQVLTNATGCDSTITLNLTITLPTSASITQAACDSFTLNSQTYTSSGTYTQVLTNAAGCDSTLTLVLTIQSLNATISVNGTTLTAVPLGMNYQWIDCNTGAPIAGATGVVFAITASGSYAVVISDGLCSDTSDCETVVGIEASIGNGPQISLYPNPAREEFRLETLVPIEEECTVQIIDMVGQTVLSNKLSRLDNGTAFDIHGLATGSYSVEVTTIGGYRWQFRLVVQ